MSQADRQAAPTFDKMHLEKGAAKRQKIVAESNVDLLSALPDELLQHVLSFLPSPESVQTCVLARRWQHQWKTVPAVRIPDGEIFENAYVMNKFVNYLMLLRKRSAVHECELHICHDDDGDESSRYLEVWIRYALSCQVRVLRVHKEDRYGHWEAPNIPLISHHLTRLELYRLELYGGPSDFSSCPALEDLKLEFCCFSTRKIISPSLKRLTIKESQFSGAVRTRISAPSLAFFVLDYCSGLSPFIEYMPSLVSAFVRLGYESHDYCSSYSEVGGCADNSCKICQVKNVENNGCVVLEGLSNAVHLALIAVEKVIIFRRDCKQSPTFGMLKTLLLSEWCVMADFSALTYLLQHTPILEKLTLELEPCEAVVETDQSYKPTDQFLASKHLKAVEIKCHKEDEVVYKIVGILNTFGVCPEKIHIQPNF